MRDHRSYLSVCLAGQGAGPTPPAVPARQEQPCGPAPSQPGQTHQQQQQQRQQQQGLQQQLYVIVDGRNQVITNPAYGVGPSRPACPDENHVWLHGAWRRVHVRILCANAPQQPQQHTRSQTAAPAAQQRHQPRSNPSPDLPAVHTTRQAGCTWDLSAILFGPSYVATMEAGGEHLRGLLTTVARAAAADHGEGVVMAITALCMGRAQWLGQARAGPRRVAHLRLRNLPAAYRDALLAHRSLVANLVRRQLGWRLVLCDNGCALPANTPTRLPSVFAALEEQQPPAGGDGESAPTAHLKMMSATVICKRSNGQTFFGVAEFQENTPLPRVFKVTYTHGATELTSESELRRTAVTSWKDVPKRYHTTLKRRLHGRMRGTNIHAAEAAAPQDAYNRLVIRKQFPSGVCYGVATYLPGEQPPYTYQVTYYDGDLETLMPRTVRRCAVKSWDRVPTNVQGVLKALGGRTLDEGGTSNAVLSPDQLQPAPATNNASETNNASTRPTNLPEHAPHSQRERAFARRRRRRVAGRRRAALRMWGTAGLTIGFINPCGLTQAKAAELQHAMIQVDIDVLGVAETWEGRCTPTNIPGYTFISKPRPDGQGGGVGFYVANTFTPVVTPHIDSCVPECLWLELRRSPRAGRPVFLGVVYLPPSTLTTADQVATTYAQLASDVQRFQSLGEVVLMGDFNSRVGKATHPGDHVGVWGEETVDAAGRALVGLLSTTDMYALNGRTPNPDPARHVPAYTRIRLNRQPDNTLTEQHAVLDYIITPKHLALSMAGGPVQAPCVLHVESKWQPTNADHLLLWCRIPCTLPQNSAPLHSRLRPNTRLLTRRTAQQEHHRQCYEIAIQQAMEGYADLVQHLQHQVDDGDLPADQAVSQAKQAFCERVHSAVDSSIGYRDTSSRRRDTRYPAVYTKEVRAAVRGKRAATQCVDHAKQAATTTGNMDALHAAYEALAAAQTNVKSAVKAARQQLQAQQVEAVYDCTARHDAKGMWNALKKLGGDKQTHKDGPTTIRREDGTLVVGSQQVADVLAAHFESVTNADKFQTGADFDDQHKQAVESDVASFRSHDSYREEGPEFLSMPIHASEVAAQCHRLQNWKSPSPLDEVHNELLKYGGEAIVHALTALFDLQFQLEMKVQTPGVIKALYKKGDPCMPTNYRPITLGSVIDKLYNSVLNARICAYLEEDAKLHEAQQGFRPGRSAVDNIFMLTQCLSARMHAKQDTYLLFLDIEKAYDSVWRAGLLWHVWNKGIKGKMFRVLAQMTDNPTSLVFHRGTFSEPFNPTMGWEQGDTLATTMFNIHVDAVLQAVWDQHEGVPLPQPLQPGPSGKLTALMYADDLAGLADSPAALQRLIDSARAALTKWRLKASVKPTDGSKTAVMVVRGGTEAARRRAARSGPAQHGTWLWGDTTIPQVRSYRYLGMWLSDAGTFDEHLEQRLQKADAAARTHYTLLQHKNLPWHMRKLTLVAVVQPVLTYACQVWMRPTQRVRQQLDGWQAALLKKMTHCPPTASTECIRRELGILPLHMACDLWTLTYWHQVCKMPSDCLLHKVFTAWSGAANPWATAINKLLAEYNINTEETENLCKSKFVAYVRDKLVAKLHNGVVVGRQQGGAVFQRYKDAFGPGDMNHSKPAARGYINILSNMKRGYAAELCMQLRAECLQLRAMHSTTRRNETMVARSLRESCPSCQQAAETAHHFLLECPAYAASRSTMLEVLQAHGQLATIQADSPEQSWRLLLTDRILGVGPITGRPRRQQHTHQRQQTMATGQQQQRQVSPTGQQQQQQRQAPPTRQQRLRQAPLIGRQQQQQRQVPLTGEQQQPTPMEAVATYVIDAWKLRSAALAGRGTNGGNSVV